MKFAPHPSATRKFGPPAGWTPEKDGECGTLEIADISDAHGHPFMESLWRPDAEDLAALNAGACIALGICGRTHPVVYMGTTAAPRHDGRPVMASMRLSFQSRVKPWMDVTFGPEISADREERNHRFLEEALELVQACGCTPGEAHQLVDYVFGRPVGERGQEVGGVMVTLAALCLANALDMDAEAERELARIWTKVDAIRAKQAAKPKHSPLPEAPAAEGGAK